jgi:hypothetical protein
MPRARETLLGILDECAAERTEIAEIEARRLALVDTNRASFVMRPDTLASARIPPTVAPTSPPSFGTKRPA